jgi:hypothetical protein
MLSITLFAEDYGHESFLTPLLERMAAQYSVTVTIRSYSVRGGHGQVVKELKEYVNDLLAFKENLPDLVLIATDANCQGFAKRSKQLNKVAAPVCHRLVMAVPDPHIERWLMLDSAAFKQVLGKACPAPDQKCNRDRYKSLLAQAVVDSGAAPLLGGMEYAEDIVREMDLERVRKQDESLSNLMDDLDSCFRTWQSRAN